MKDLGLGVDLSPSVQQQPHHDHVATPGGDVQGSDAVLQGGVLNQFVRGSVVDVAHLKNNSITSLTAFFISNQLCSADNLLKYFPI